MQRVHLQLSTKDSHRPIHISAGPDAPLRRLPMERLTRRRDWPSRLGLLPVARAAEWWLHPTPLPGYSRDMSAKTGTEDSVRVLIRALDQTGDVLDRVHADDLLSPTPCDGWSVSALIDHLVAAPVRFLARTKGAELEWSAVPPHVAHGWGSEFRNHADDLVHAWHQLEGDPPTPAQWQIAELAVHTWDLATAIGLPLDRLDPEVAETSLGFMRANLRPELRGQAFAPEQPAPPDAGPYAQLAAFTGRVTG
jgi:uncharacterized protein (TIGR03086 family)